MDDGRFDAMVRVLGAGTHRRRVLAGLLAGIPLGLAGQDAAAKGKRKKNKKKKNKKTSASCPHEQNCAGKQCGDDGCDGVCGSCDQFPNSFCTDEALCDCEPNCAGKNCGGDGCGSTCGSCQNGTCDNGLCVCAQGTPCGPNSTICCLTGTTCREDGSACCRTECAGRCGVHHDTCSGEPLDCGGCSTSDRVCSDPDNGGTCVCRQRQQGGIQTKIPGCDGF